MGTFSSRYLFQVRYSKLREYGCQGVCMGVLSVTDRSLLLEIMSGLTMMLRKLCLGNHSAFSGIIYTSIRLCQEVHALASLFPGASSKTLDKNTKG